MKTPTNTGRYQTPTAEFRFKQIIKPIDVAKTGGLGQLDVRHGLHQFSTSAQRQHLGDQKVDRQCLNAIAILQWPRHVLRTTPLGSGAALGAVFDIRDDHYFFNREFDIEQDTLFTSRCSVSERSVPQLPQASTVEISSTVVVSKFSPVTEFRAALVSRFFLSDFLVSSLPVCDGGMLEFLLVFFGRLFEEDGNHDSQQTAHPSKNHIGFF